MAAATKLGCSLSAHASYTQLLDEPHHLPSYHALFDAYRRADQLDPAYCVASVLTLLHEATAEEQAFVQSRRSSRWVAPRGRLSSEQLVRHVVHPDQDLLVTEIMGLIAPAVASWRAHSHPAPLRADQAIDVDTDRSPLAKIVAKTCCALGFGKPDLFMRPRDPGLFTMMNLKRDHLVRPTLLVWGDLDRGESESFVACQLGRGLMELWRPYYCFMALDRSTQAMKQVLMACLYATGLPHTGDVRSLQTIGTEIVTRTSGSDLVSLRRALRRLFASGRTVDVQRWAAAAELTACRMGLLIGGDLRVAVRALATSDGCSGVSAEQKREELRLYGISEGYFAARRALAECVGED